MKENGIRTSTLLMLAGVALLATLLGQTWQAAEQQRPLDASDLRTGLFVALAVVGALWLASTARAAVHGASFRQFDGTSRAALVAAQDEALRLSHNYVGTEHILMGLLAATEGRAASLLALYGIDLQTARRQTEQLIGHGETGGRDRPGLTPRARRAIELAVQAA